MIEKKELSKSEAKEKALRLLEFRAHSEKELADKLKRAGAKEEDIWEIMDFLREYELVNDLEYARRLSADLKNLKKLGRRRIKDELWNKGIKSEDIEIVLSELSEDDPEDLLPLVEKKLGGNLDKKNTDRAIRYFLYRGYSFEDIKACLEKLAAEFLEE